MICVPPPHRCPSVPTMFHFPTLITHTLSNYTFIPRHLFCGVCICFYLRLVMLIPVIYSSSTVGPAPSYWLLLRFFTFCSDLCEPLLCCFHIYRISQV